MLFLNDKDHAKVLLLVISIFNLTDLIMIKKENHYK